MEVGPRTTNAAPTDGALVTVTSLRCADSLATRDPPARQSRKQGPLFSHSTLDEA